MIKCYAAECFNQETGITHTVAFPIKYVSSISTYLTELSIILNGTHTTSKFLIPYCEKAVHLYEYTINIKDNEWKETVFEGTPGVDLPNTPKPSVYVIQRKSTTRKALENLKESIGMNWNDFAVIKDTFRSGNVQQCLNYWKVFYQHNKMIKLINWIELLEILLENGYTDVYVKLVKDGGMPIIRQIPSQ